MAAAELDASAVDLGDTAEFEELEEAIEAEMKKQFDLAGRTLAKSLGTEYSVEEFERRTEHPYVRHIMTGSREVAEYNVRRLREHQQRLMKSARERKKSRCSIFNAYDTIIGRIPSMFQRELKDILFRDSQEKVLREDTYVFPDLALLQNEGYIRRHTEHWRGADVKEQEQLPCFYPMRTRMRRRRINTYTKEMRDQNLDQLSGLGNRGPLGALPNAHWSLFFCNLPQSFEWMFKALRALQGEDLHDAAGDLVPGTAFEYAVRLCPVANFYQELYATMGNHVILREDLEKNGFTGDLISSSMREGFRPSEEMAIPDTPVEEQMADLLDTLFTHFKVHDRSQIQPLLSKVLDYICPGVLEIIKAGR